MALIPNSVADILKSKTMRGLPRPVDYPKLRNSDTRSLGLHFDSIAYVPSK